MMVSVPRMSGLAFFGFPEYNAGMDVRNYIDKMHYREHLKDLNWSQAELARRLGVLPSTVTAWGDDPPQYALAYLSLALELKGVRDRAGKSLERTKP